MALTAGTMPLKDKVVVEDVVISQPLFLEESEAKKVQVVITPHEPSIDSMSGQTGYAFEIFSRPLPQPEWTLHASGKIWPTVFDYTNNDQSNPPASLFV